MKVCIFSGKSVGGTFLDWSIHFVSGQTDYFSIAQDQYIDLVEDPTNQLTGNAHNHQKNHPPGYIGTKKVLESTSDHKLLTFYTAPLRHDVAAQRKNVPLSKDIVQDIDKEISDDTQKLFSLCSEHNVKIIHLAGESNIPLYFVKLRTFDDFFVREGKPKSLNEAKEELEQFFFSDSVETWNQLGLTNLWDVRERRALNCRPLSQIDEIHCKEPHLRIDCREFWINGEAVIKRVLNYLKLDIDLIRFEKWKHIHRKWAQTHLDSMSFVYNCDHILESIVNNWDYSIDLSFDEEVVIQHFLIYKYNLNLKTWGLEKFPDNTQKLHELLEPNAHPITDLYSING